MGNDEKISMPDPEEVGARMSALRAQFRQASEEQNATADGAKGKAQRSDPTPHKTATWPSLKITG